MALNSVLTGGLYRFNAMFDPVVIMFLYAYTCRSAHLCVLVHACGYMGVRSRFEPRLW